MPFEIEFKQAGPVLGKGPDGGALDVHGQRLGAANEGGWHQLTGDAEATAVKPGRAEVDAEKGAEGRLLRQMAFGRSALHLQHW